MLGTITVRGSFIFLSGKMQISPKLRELFSYIPAAVLPALIVPASYFHQGKLALIFGKERFIILLLSVVVAYFVRNTLFIVCFGLGLLFLVTQVL